jgi:hypothetical protein
MAYESIFEVQRKSNNVRFTQSLCSKSNVVVEDMHRSIGEK